MTGDLPGADPRLVTRRRKRRPRQGFARVELQRRAEDAAPFRGVASASRDPARGDEARDIPREKGATSSKVGAKALLASAPLEGIDLDRPRDLGRDVFL